MNNDDLKILREIEYNASQAISIIELLSDEVYDKGLLEELHKEKLGYMKISEKAQEHEPDLKRKGVTSDLLRRLTVWLKKLYNCSTSNITELKIADSSKVITNMCRCRNHFTNAGSFAMEMADELIVLEQGSIERLKKFL